MDKLEVFEEEQVVGPPSSKSMAQGSPSMQRGVRCVGGVVWPRCHSDCTPRQEFCRLMWVSMCNSEVPPPPPFWSKSTLCALPAAKGQTEHEVVEVAVAVVSGRLKVDFGWVGVSFLEWQNVTAGTFGLDGDGCGIWVGSGPLLGMWLLVGNAKVGMG